MTETPTRPIPNSCERCGRSDGEHSWVEGDCILRHRNHSTKLIDGGHVCVHCVDRHIDTLKEIVELYATLDQVLLSSDVTVEETRYEKPRKAPASPSPIRLAAWALLHPEQLNGQVRREETGKLENVSLGAHLPDIPDLLSNWVGAMYDEMQWTGPPTTVAGCAASLSANAEQMGRLPDVDEYDAELRWMLRSLRSAHGVAAPRPLGECLSVECGGRVWMSTDQRGKCSRCKRQYGTNAEVARIVVMEDRRRAGRSTDAGSPGSVSADLRSSGRGGQNQAGYSRGLGISRGAEEAS